MSTKTGEINKLTAQDRCDACGAQAFIRATFLNGELLFCNHHWRKHKEKASSNALKVEDYSDSINSKPSVSSY
ncbi:MAG: hypothetical protein ACKOW9_03490 [Candidatus Paceibacterota bacterium]